MQSLLPSSFNRQEFLSGYWQKKPLLIRGDTQSSGTGTIITGLDADTIAGLACELEAESRLVRQCREQVWNVTHGPQSEDVLMSLAPEDWILLVQAVDLWLPEVAEIKQAFDFLPAWRIDDIMVSVAADHGSVGPHFDYYDVFLIQGRGRRCWQIGGHCGPETELHPHQSLRLLKEFRPVAEYILETGDILYIPPGFSHSGVSMGESTCFSVGFRSPSLREMIIGLAETVAEDLEGDQRFVDASITASGSAQIPGESLRDSFEQASQIFVNFDACMRWFGCSVTEPRCENHLGPPNRKYTLEELNSAVDTGRWNSLMRHPSSRFAFHLAEKNSAGDCLLFVDGMHYCWPGGRKAELKRLCDEPAIALNREDPLLNQPVLQTVLLQLLNQGSLVPDTDFEPSVI